MKQTEKKAEYVLQNKEQTFLPAHRAIMFPNYVGQCLLILPVPNSLTAACPFLDQYFLQWYHTGQEKPESKKQTNVIVDPIIAMVDASQGQKLQFPS